MLRRFVVGVKRKIAQRNSLSYIRYLRKMHVQIGEECVFRDPKTTCIDVQRPELINIGNNVDMNRNFTIMTHDWSSLVFRSVFNEIVNSTGKVTIGNNVYFGTNVTILKGVTIGDNCIVGAGAIITKDIPSNSVAVGIPCRVVCSLKDYYEKRTKQCLAEAVERVNCFIDCYGRDPLPKELCEEFIYYVNKENALEYESIGVPIRSQLAGAYVKWMQAHERSQFSDFEAFLEYCKKRRVQ